MNLIRFLFRYSRWPMIWTAAAAFLAGMCNAGLIAVVNAVLNGSKTSFPTLVWIFVALGAARIFSNFLAQETLSQFAQTNTARIRFDLIQKILAVPLRQLEELGAPRLMVALTEDLMDITEAMQTIPTFGVNLAILLGGAIYLAYLSPQILAAMVGLIVVGAVAYRLLIRQGWRHLALARAEQDRLFRHFRALTEGVKELKLHRERRGVFLEENVRTTTQVLRRHNIAGELRFILAANWSHFLFFSLIGLILFLLPKMEHISPHAMTGYVVATLYLMGPLSGVLSSLSLFGRASVGLRKIEELGLALAVRSTDDGISGSRKGVPRFERLDLVGITHSYHHEKDDNHFLLGPIHLSFQPGELTFLVGGNGSGKSTLAKVITGLYPPATGEIRLNGQPVTNYNRDDYRQLFSAVFGDFYLFESLLGLHSANLDERARDYLAQLHLDHKVKVRHGVLSTTDLSQGQRKRLALLTAYLEDRPIYVFDEWASDQDPLFKDVFYTQVLPELKARNKTVIVITHDDRYFNLADRVLKLDYGQLVTADTDLPHEPTREPAARMA